MVRLVACAQRRLVCARARGGSKEQHIQRKVMLVIRILFCDHRRKQGIFVIAREDRRLGRKYLCGNHIENISNAVLFCSDMGCMFFNIVFWHIIHTYLIFMIALLMVPALKICLSTSNGNSVYIWDIASYENGQN